MRVDRAERACTERKETCRFPIRSSRGALLSRYAAAAGSTLPAADDDDEEEEDAPSAFFDSSSASCNEVKRPRGGANKSTASY